MLLLQMYQSLPHRLYSRHLDKRIFTTTPNITLVTSTGSDNYGLKANVICWLGFSLIGVADILYRCFQSIALVDQRSYQIYNILPAVPPINMSVLTVLKCKYHKFCHINWNMHLYTIIRPPATGYDYIAMIIPGMCQISR